MSVTEPAGPGREATKNEGENGFELSDSRMAVFDRASYIVPCAIFLISRIALALLARWAPSVLPGVRTNPSVLPRSDPLASVWSWSSPWFRFDASWYVGVAQHGYHWGRVAETNTNFFPLYPLLIKIVHPFSLGSYWIAALLIANLSFLAALILVWNWARAKWDSQVAMRAALFVTVFPFSFFFAAPYAEPVFLAFAVASFLFAERDSWMLATVCAALSAVTRPVGLAVVAALITLSIVQGRWRPALVMCAAVLPFLLYLVYLGVTLGHPLGFAVYHTGGWVPPRGSIFHTVAIQFNTPLSPFDRVDAAVSVLFAGSAIIVWKWMGHAYAIYVLLGIALPLSRSLAGMERYVIVLFPAMAAWALSSRKAVHLAVFALSLFLLVIATSMFATGYSLF